MLGFVLGSSLFLLGACSRQGQAASFVAPVDSAEEIETYIEISEVVHPLAQCLESQKQRQGVDAEMMANRLFSDGHADSLQSAAEKYAPAEVGNLPVSTKLSAADVQAYLVALALAATNDHYKRIDRAKALSLVAYYTSLELPGACKPSQKMLAFIGKDGV